MKLVHTFVPSGPRHAEREGGKAVAGGVALVRQLVQSVVKAIGQSKGMGCGM